MRLRHNYQRKDLKMECKYVGPHDEVDVPALRQVVKHGDSVNVTNEQGAALIEQTTNWIEAKTGSKKESKGV